MELERGYTERVANSHAVVFSPDAEGRDTWYLTTLPPRTATIGTGSWVSGFEIDTSHMATPEEKRATAVKAAKKFLGLPQ